MYKSKNNKLKNNKNNKSKNKKNILIDGVLIHKPYNKYYDDNIYHLMHYLFDGMTDKFDFNSATGVFDYVGEYLEEDEETKEFDKKPQNSVSRKEKSVLLERFHQLGL